MRGLVVVAAVAAFAVVTSACGQSDAEAIARGEAANRPAGPEVQISTGLAHPMLGADNHWTAWAYRNADGLVCTEFRWQDGRGDGGCGGGDGPMITRDPGTTWVSGSTTAPGATQVRIVLDQHPAVVLDLVPGSAVVEAANFYAASLDGGPTVTAVVVLDANGNTVDSTVIP